MPLPTLQAVPKHDCRHPSANAWTPPNGVRCLISNTAIPTPFLASDGRVVSGLVKPEAWGFGVGKAILEPRLKTQD